MTYCDNCEASLSETDYDCGRCTQCGHQITTEEITTMKAQIRFHMSNGFVMVEHTERGALEQIRKEDARFCRRRIIETVQMYPSQIDVGVVYEVDSNPPQRA